MEDDILAKVVEVEKEVQQRLVVEEKMSQEWLENVKKDAEEKVISEEKVLKDAINEAISKARLNAEQKGEAIIKNVNIEAKKLEEIGDDVLKKIVLEHIIKILPGN
jgi:transcriptional regulator NrdR family protein